jgi:uncharacterized protein
MSLRLVAILLAGGFPLAAAADCPTRGLTPIAQLKGTAGDTRQGERVLVRGVVTGDFRGEDRLRGFWLQSRSGEDGLPAGIFVFLPGQTRDAAPVAPGVELAVRARADEFRGLRQLSQVEHIEACDEPGLPPPVSLPFPAAAPSQLGRYEGLYVRLSEPLTVSGNHELARFGSLALSVGGRLFRPTNAVETRAGNSDLRRLVLDDGSYKTGPKPVPYLDHDGTRRIGSEIISAAGILTHAFGDWRLHPLEVSAVQFRDANPRPAPPARGPGARITGFNVENYFLTPGQRGAANARALDEQRRRIAAVAEGLAPDLVGLIEVENRPGTVADLAHRFGEAAGITGGYRHFHIDGAVGTDVIRVMLAWDPERVTLLAGPFIDDDPAHHRPPVAGHFRTGGDGAGKLVVAIHHKSKSGCPASGDIDRGQGCWNLLRTAQSEALARFLARLQRETGTDRVLIIGDINSYGDEDPVRVLHAAGYVDLVAARLPPESRYSYVFQGESGYLDTALASPGLADDVGKVAFWHINADEPPELHDFAKSKAAGPWRSSDHDPVVVDLE